MAPLQAQLAAETRDELARALAAFAAAGGDPLAPPRALRELLGRFALDQVHQFVGILSPDGTVLEANQAALSAGGLQARDVVGRPVWETGWWTASPATQARLEEAVALAACGELVRFEADVLAGDAGRRLVTIDFSLRPVHGADGAVSFLVAEGRDISEKKRAEAELARHNEELRALYERVSALDRTKTQLFANVSHELRTPLALVLGPLERVLEGGNLSAEQRHALAVAERNARTVLKHVNALLEVSRIDGGGVRLDRAAVDLARLVRLAAAHFDAIALERRVALALELPASLVAEVDADRFERVVLNLLSNAFKFTPEAGRVRVSLRAAGGSAQLEVADSGPGIPPEHREAVFERFRQIETAGARREDGIGLGLAIAKEIVELHGGRIHAAAAPEGGALLALELPLAAPEGAEVRRARPPVAAAPGEPGGPEESAPREAPATGAGGERPLVLVVEDNVEMSEFVRGALAPELRSAAARDGEEGLRLARELRPDLVVTDVMMAGGPGDALVRALRRDPELAAIPVLVLSAKADDALRARLLAEGAQDYVAKPVPVAELRARVRNLVSMKRARDVLREELADQAEDVERLAAELARRRRELQTALDAMRFAREQADRASAQKTTLVRLVSHELRTPLSALLLQVERMRRDAAHLSPQHRDAVARMRASTQRLTGLVESLLEYTRIEAGRMTLELAPLDAGRLVAEVVEELRPVAAQKSLALRAPAPGALPPLETDARLLRLVLLNLVSNAIKFTDEGSVTVSLSTHDGEHCLLVRDTGRGIAREDQARIFEPFEQLEAISLKHTPGIGLGLALVREMVAALGGRITLSSAPGEGSAFCVALPSSPRDAARPAPTPPH